jgi:hypothetical protein
MQVEARSIRLVASKTRNLKNKDFRTNVHLATYSFKTNIPITFTVGNE